MIFYFTATGNSLYIARQLADNPVSIPQVKRAQTYQGESIGIVSPVYCGELPGPVLEFIRNAKFETPYLYLILTYGMSESDCPEFTYNQCRKLGVEFDYIGAVRMVDNYLPAFDMNEEAKLDKQVQQQLALIRENIRSRKREIPVAAEEDRKLHKQVAMMNKVFPGMNSGKGLTFTDKCTGCGICAKVCPLGNIQLQKGKAGRTHKKCAFCLACIQNCPRKAIVLKRERNPQARYRHPEVTLEDIIQANHQK